MRAKILLLEDEPICQVFILRLFMQQEYEIDIAQNGKEGVAKFCRNYADYSLVITDIGLPDITGVEAVQQMRQYEREQGIGREYQMPVVALSSHMNPNIHKECIQVGMQKTYTKPLKPEEITAILKMVENVTV